MESLHVVAQGKIAFEIYQNQGLPGDLPLPMKHYGGDDDFKGI